MCVTLLTGSSSIHRLKSTGVSDLNSDSRITEGEGSGTALAVIDQEGSYRSDVVNPNDPPRRRFVRKPGQSAFPEEILRVSRE